MKRNKDVERDVFGEDLRPDYKLGNERVRITAEVIPLNHSPEDIARRAERDRQALITRAKNFEEKPQFFDTLQMVNIEVINDQFSDWNFFEMPTRMEQAELMRSIEHIGLINPIHVTLDKQGRYNVIIGRCRLLAYCNLFTQTGDERYRTIPCFVIPYEEVDELYIRSMIIESNIEFRRISKPTMVRAVLENYEIMKRVKQNRNETNIGMALAEQFQVSEATIYNYIKLKDLCDPGLTLLYDGDITIQVATYLTKVPKETQIEILKTCGLEEVKSIFKLKLLTEKEDITVEEIKKTIERVEKLVPEVTTIILEIRRGLLSSFMRCLLEFMRNDASKFAGNHTKGNFNKVFKVRFNQRDIQYYKEKDLIDDIVLKKLTSKSVQEMAKVK